MEDIIEPTMDYDFTKLFFGPPSTLAGGAYFTRIMHKTNKPLFIQTPKSLTKQGFIKSGKKVYTDLMFDNNDTIFINWIENLESRCQDLVYSKRESWFESKLEKDDIESAFTSPFKIFKSGKYYLLRVNVKPNIKIYNEQDQIVPIDSITSDKTIISILEIQGLKFTSRNFQIEIELKQSMIVSPDPFLDECFIRKPVKKQPAKESNIEEQEDIDLDNLINQSVKDLASTKDLALTNDVASTKDLVLTNDVALTKDVSLTKDVVLNRNNEPINLEVSFDELLNKQTTEFDGLEEADIVLDVEDLEPKEEIKEDPGILKEVDLSSTLDNSLETIQLKKPNQVYYEIYKKAREKAKDAKKNAILAYLEMKNIKKTYMLDDIDESDNDSDFEDFASRDSKSEISDTESLEDDF
jgi:rRNA-processing protein FCF1